MIKSVLGLGKTTSKSLETTGPLELPTGAEVIAVLETLAKGEKISAQDPDVTCSVAAGRALARHVGAGRGLSR